MNNSQANQAKLNNAQWLKSYREQMSQATPEMSPVDMSSNINVALRDPVNGQATATGLAAGQSLLNSWIAGANANARKKADQLAQERWIKQQEDLAEERAYQRARDAKNDVRVVADEPYDVQAWKEGILDDPSLKKDYDLLNSVQTANTPGEEARLRLARMQARKRLNAAQESAPMQVTKANSKAIDIESTGGFMNNMEGLLNWIPGYRRIALNPEQRAMATMRKAMAQNGSNVFSGVSSQALRKEASENAAKGHTNTAIQQRKMAEFIDLYMQQNPGSVAKQSPSGSMIVLASPSGERAVLTPETIDNYLKQFNISVR